MRNTSAWSVDAFKNKLDILLQKIEDTPLPPTYYTWPYYKLEHRVPLHVREKVEAVACGAEAVRQESS